MKKLSKRFAIFALLILFVQTFMFSAEEKSLLDLNKEVLSLKYELYQIENKLGEYKDMSSFKLFFTKAKKEHLLRKRETELKARASEDAEKAKEAFNKAKDELSGAGKDLKKLGQDIGDAFKDFLN